MGGIGIVNWPLNSPYHCAGIRMNNTTFTVYWLETNTNGEKVACFEQSPHMRASMNLLEALRKHPSASAVTFCSECTDQVGKMGVDAVVGGILPDGQEYVYKTGRGNP